MTKRQKFIRERQIDNHEMQWQEIIDRRSREIAEGKVSCRPVEQVVRDIRNKLNARRQTS